MEVAMGPLDIRRWSVDIGERSLKVGRWSRTLHLQVAASAALVLAYAACGGSAGPGVGDTDQSIVGERSTLEPRQLLPASATARPPSQSYPDPAAGPTRSPTATEAEPTPRDLDAEILSVLPADAEPDPAGPDDWRLAAPYPGRIYSIAYRLGKQASVATVLLPDSAAPRLLWDLARDGGLNEAADEAWPIDLLHEGDQAIVVKTAGGRWLLRLAFDDTVSIVERFELPEAFSAEPDDYYYANLIERDLSGDGRPDRILDLGGAHIYESLPDGGLRLAGTLERGDLLIDHDRDGLPDLVKPGVDGEWTLQRWRDGGFQATGEILADPHSHQPVAVTDGDLPALPGNLSFLIQGERALKRWPREGGAVRRLWSAGDRKLSMRGLEVSEDGSAMLLALASDAKGYAGPASLSLVEDYVKESELPTHGELRGFTISPDGQRIAYVGLGVDADGNARSQTGEFKPLEQGAVFAIDRTSPDRATGLADCAAVQANPWWVVGCRGSVISSPDSRTVAFSDARGLWLVGFDGSTARKVIEQFYVEDDGPGSRIYYPERFSPDGQRLLTNLGGYEGTTPTTLDLATGETGEIPDAWNYGRLSEQAWRPDGRGLLVSRWGSDTEGQSELRLVDVASPRDGRPVLDVVPISAAHRYLAYGPAVAPDGSLRFGLRHPNTRLWLANGIYRTAADGSAMQRLARLPAPGEDEFGPRDLLWSPDADAFMVSYKEAGKRRVMVGLSDGSALWDASALLGRADRIRWSR